MELYIVTTEGKGGTEVGLFGDTAEAVKWKKILPKSLVHRVELDSNKNLIQFCKENDINI
jgi:hypothetical protein